MKEIKCPKCGSVFSVDEADYASILSQVKNAEFESEIQRRLSEIALRNKAEQELAFAKEKQKYDAVIGKKEQELGNKDAEIARLSDQLKSIVNQKESITFKKSRTHLLEARTTCVWRTTKQRRSPSRNLCVTILP